MKRTTITLPDELDARLRFEAAGRGMTISELTRGVDRPRISRDGLPAQTEDGRGRPGRRLQRRRPESTSS